MRLKLSPLALGLALAASAAGAQPTFHSTGTAGSIDPYWTVSCEVIGPAGTPACPASGFVAASVVTATPYGWAAVPTSGASYIGALPSGSPFPEGTGETPNYQYTFRQMIDFGGLDPIGQQLVLSTLRIDNYWVGYRVNGGAIVPAGISPTPVAAVGNNWETNFALTVPAMTSGWTSGVNSFDIIVTGNGRTDGILAVGEFRTVPEPSTYALMGTGLAGLGVAAARRRRTTA